MCLCPWCQGRGRCRPRPTPPPRCPSPRPSGTLPWRSCRCSMQPAVSNKVWGNSFTTSLKETIEEYVLLTQICTFVDSHPAMYSSASGFRLVGLQSHIASGWVTSSPFNEKFSALMNLWKPNCFVVSKRTRLIFLTYIHYALLNIFSQIYFFFPRWGEICPQLI